MKKCNKLVRDNVSELLQEQGFNKINQTKIKGKKYKAELYSLFLAEYKETLEKDKSAQLQIHYAEMLEVVRTLMIASKTDINDITTDNNQTMEWYKKASPSKRKLGEARIDLLQKFYELLNMKTEAIKDQLGDILKSFKQLVETHKVSFVKVEQTRRTMFKKLGGYSKGVYLESVSKTSTYSY